MFYHYGWVAVGVWVVRVFGVFCIYTVTLTVINYMYNYYTCHIRTHPNKKMIYYDSHL